MLIRPFPNVEYVQRKNPGLLISDQLSKYIKHEMFTLILPSMTIDLDIAF